MMGILFTKMTVYYIGKRVVFRTVHGTGQAPINLLNE